MLCWHRRARKTTLGLNLLIREAFENPRKVYGYIGPTYKQAKAIVWRDPNMLMRYLPDDIVLRKNESELFVEFHNGSMLAITGADEPDSIRGRDFQGIFCDEWALMKDMVWTEILRPIITQAPDRWAMFAFTPKGRNFVYDYWIKADVWTEWYKSFLPLSRSCLLPENEIEKARKEMPVDLFEQEFECSFLADEERTLIPARSVEDLRGVRIYWKEIKRIVACDPSQGGDECVIYAIENSEIKETKILHVRDTMVIAGEIAVMMQKHRAPRVIVDSIGIGAGIYDRLNELGYNVIGVQSAERADQEDRFYNRRTEMWWYMMEQIRDKKIAYPEDAELRRELSFVKYRVVNSNGRIQLDSKDMTKEMLGRSPDRADAFVYGIWGLSRVEPIKHKDRWRETESRDVGSGTRSAMSA